MAKKRKVSGDRNPKPRRTPSNKALKNQSTEAITQSTTDQGVSSRETIATHFNRVREALVALFKNSKSASHGVVQGALREGFVHSVLKGHLGDSLAWSSGQIVTRAPKNWQSGQLDLILHRSDSPQIHLHDGFLRLIPSSAAIAVIEVKSNLTTGAMEIGKSSALLHALDSLCNAIKTSSDLEPIPSERNLGSTRALPTFLVAFTSGQTPDTIVEKVSEYLKNRNLDARAFWPWAILVLSGGRAAETGFVIARDEESRFGGVRPKTKKQKDKEPKNDATGSAPEALTIVTENPVAVFLCLLNLAVLSAKNLEPVDLADYVFPKPSAKNASEDKDQPARLA
jgi:hypothetical protein